MPRSIPKKSSRKSAATGTPPSLPTLGYAILSSLAHHTHTGYELSQRMGPPKNFMWQARHSQVYPALQLLARQGLVVFKDVPQEGKPAKKIYEITEKGLEALRAWARKGPTQVPVRDEFSLKMAALRTLPIQQAIDVLALQIDLVEGEIEEIEAHLDEFSRRMKLPNPVPSNHRQFCLISAIRLSRDLKITAVAAYRRLLAELSSDTNTGSVSQCRETNTL